MGVAYITAVADRVEFRKARQESGMTADDVDCKSGWYRGTCGRFELDTRPMSELDEQKLIDFLQAVIAYECTERRDYRAAILAYRAAHGCSRCALARKIRVCEQVIRDLENGEIKTRIREHNRKKLDAFFFAD